MEMEDVNEIQEIDKEGFKWRKNLEFECKLTIHNKQNYVQNWLHFFQTIVIFFPSLYKLFFFLVNHAFRFL